jgi:molybdopterin molybdotransferase
VIELAEARRLLRQAVSRLETVERELAGALGHVLAEDVAADRDFPATDRSAMDGFALRSADVPDPGRSLRIVGEVRAGVAVDGLALGRGEALRIYTGAPVPAGADAVVMVELTVEDRAAGTVLVRERPEAGQNIRRRGEDVTAGETILRAGAAIHAAELAALAAVGARRVRVIRAPQVAILSTGDEIVEEGGSVAPHQVRNSNAPMLAAQLAELGIPSCQLGVAGDDGAQLERALSAGLAADVLLVSGGVSVGAYDLVGQALQRAGLELIFHGVAMKPGKPILAGRCGRTLVFGLPGNPISAFTGFHVLVAPAIRTMVGHAHPDATELRAVLGGRIARKPGRITFALAHLALEDGRLVARPVRTASSGDVASLPRANAFVVAPGGPHALEDGAEVTVLPWRDFDRRG